MACRVLVKSPDNLEKFISRKMAAGRERIRRFLADEREDIIPELSEAEILDRTRKIKEVEENVDLGKLYEDRGVSWEEMKDIVLTGEKLGSGSFGDVYAKGDVAVKIGSLVSKEVENSKMAASLGIGPKVLGVADLDAMAMERIRGIRIQEIRESSPHSELIPMGLKQRVVDSLFEEFKKIHGMGVAHNDLNGGNIIVTSDGSVRLIDFAFSDFGDKKSAAIEARSNSVIAALSTEISVSSEVDDYLRRKRGISLPSTYSDPDGSLRTIYED
ncbi:ChoK-like putative serine/threonine kinase [Synechococcus phage S-CBWM1]|uniref:ChoK-like putative serine/threonine kinase n=1 Tax=Synechococcus phage S-CBWM1 TaxID=2053653 RepID=A0A3G1L3T6_9CAUD|nr:ChoK-like putative serine/threonine kinase [Synechococcus phage S-CBWM1]ATW62845.1 ChoK-like putative serine/threonine kinase [Synechococcus phage S-CBWM1]